jgi:DNA-binding response OmpR family regulator
MPHILLIEDDVPLREEICEFFSRRKHTVRAVGHLAEARIAIAECAPDVVISDVNLPDGDGAALCAEYAPRLRATRWILLTGNPESVGRTRQAKGDDDAPICMVLDKPASMRVLAELVQATTRKDDMFCLAPAATSIDDLELEQNVDLYLSRVHETWDAEQRDGLLRRLAEMETRMGQSRLHFENDERRVIDGRERVNMQRERVAALAAMQHPRDRELSLLNTLERTQALLEAHLESLRERFARAKL